jgi:hypothetical protein
VDDGKPPNHVKTVICDPGLREFEARKPGLFYSIISRGTTMGTLENGKRSGSAIYFYDYGFGSVMTPARITNLWVSLKTNQKYVNISKRDKWVSHLQKNQLQEHKEDDEVKELFKWAKHKKVPPENLDTLLHTKPKWRKKSDNYNL